ncbi:PIN2/TERF1-interacting telomerase inhibitor 1 [Operophtera brumata]|uniref:PIN2/TERF1-interacting telomerase inhibitor 1 n=1 Tax=Operophtera brumata TaxID=104452 RepID=A0A0L7LTQ7_OPEBR|nr:PIN2/TERF1-interacting telomerase inhibitor 1 [Operophtera brumata]
MAMLAEPRRKQKVINLRAKNNAWSNDSGKFGQRMLEKMGWSSGKGLGAHENGIVEHVVAKYKNDDRGLGFEDRNDQWTKHEDDFNSLLANLSNGEIKEEKLHSGVSLEVKSKKSKARVHYHKYTRGKDLTRYSEKDLANIFGKKTLKIQEKTPEILKPDDLKSTEVVFTEKGSMEDYFKSKLAALKGKNKVSFTNNCDNTDEGDYSFRGFAGTGNDGNEQADTVEQNEVAFQGFSFYGKNSADNKASEEPVETSDEPVKKKSKKKSKNKSDITIDNHQNTSPDTLPEDLKTEENEPIKKKKSKKNKHKIEDVLETPEAPPKKSKSKKKNIEDNLIIEEHIDEVVYVPKKKKKRKNKDNEV